MENNVGNLPTRKPRSPHVSRKTNGTNNGLDNEYLKKGNASTPKTTDLKNELSPKEGEINEIQKMEGDGPRRPNTVSGALGKKVEFGESPSIPTSKSFPPQPKCCCFDHSPEGRSSSVSPSTKFKRQCLGKKARSPVKGTYRINCTEDSEFTSLLPQAIFEQGQVMETLSVAREELREKMAEQVKSRDTAQTNFTGDFADSFPPKEPPNATSFENSYSGTLEEIFQAWVNLFYFIINLKFNLIRVLNSSGTEPFKPNSEMEREIVGQAIECVKFFSKLKIKSLSNAVEDLRLSDDHNISEIQIKDYEERVSTPFLREMDFIQKKAKEILEQTKKRTNVQL